MKKILLVCNGEMYCKHLTYYGIQLARKSNAILHAVFVSPFVEQINQFPFPGELPLVAENIIGTRNIEQQHHDLIQSNVDLFISDCTKAAVPYKINSDSDVSVSELVDQSALADLVLCDSKEQYGTYSFKDFIADVHCPVLLISERSRIPGKVIFCYDESYSSIHAIKMYSYLFPEWNQLPTSFVMINPKGDNGNKYDEYLDEWLAESYRNVQKIDLQGNLQKELTDLVKQDEANTMVVLGSFGGNAVSRIFHRSLVSVVLEETGASLFAVHE